MVKKKLTEKDLMEQKQALTDEQVSIELVKIYFEEVARLGFKRNLDLDAVINAYFYALKRVQQKDEEIAALEEIVSKEEKSIGKE